MLRLITEEEAKMNKVKMGVITPEIRPILGKPIGYPTAFIATGEIDENRKEVVQAFRIYQAHDILINWEDARCWTGFLPQWA